MFLLLSICICIFVTSVVAFRNSVPSGFFGLIGPNIDKQKVNSLFDLFTEDGIIHGVFIENGEITPVRHLIQTEKIKYEKIHGKFSKEYTMLPIYMFLNYMRLLPNILGVSNTAFLDTNIKGMGTGTGTSTNNIFTTFERDRPYKISLNHQTKEIQTICKMDTKEITHFSGHSKYDLSTQIIHTIDYDVMFNTVSYFQMNQLCDTILKRVRLRTTYIPIIHDFHVLENQGILYMDAPFVWNFFSNIPVVFDKKKPVYINIYNTTTHEKIRYTCPTAFYMFHYAYVIEMNETIEIYGPLDDSLDFSSLNIEGKYRKIVLDKRTKCVHVEKNAVLENMNLDFPVKWRDMVLLRKLENNVINGFVLCRGLEIIKQIELPVNRYLCGEPAIVQESGYVLGIAYDDENNGYFIAFDILDITNTYIETPLYYKPTIGFHAIYKTCEK